MRLEPVRVEPYFQTATPRHPWVTAEQSPIYRLRFPTDGTNAQVDALFEALMDWWPQVRTPVAWQLDYRSAGHILDWHARSDRFAQFARRVEPFARGKTICHAVLGRDELALSALRTMFWRDPMQFPRRFFVSEDEALTWMRLQFTFASSTPRARSV